MNIVGHFSRVLYLLSFAVVAVAACYTVRHGCAAAAMQCRSRGLREIMWPRITEMPRPPDLARIVHRNKMRRGLTILIAGWFILAGSFALGSTVGGWNLPVTTASADAIKMWWSAAWLRPNLED